jgi:hypothetical protein
MIAILSAAGIALMALVLMTVGAHGALKLLFTAGVFLAFLTSLWISLGGLEKSVESLMLSLKEGTGRDLNLDGSIGVAKRFFVLGCTCLIALGLFSVWTPKFKKACCPMNKAVIMKDQASHEASNAKESEEAKISGQSDADTASVTAGSQGTSKKTTTASLSQGSATGTVSQTAPKKSGNAGVFPRGVSR